jgi:hypothetical protein
MNEGILAIYFLETVDVQSVNYSCISLLDSFDGAVSYTLNGGSLLALRDPDSFSGSGSDCKVITPGVGRELVVLVVAVLVKILDM